MRIVQIITSYASAVVFAALASRAMSRWSHYRERRSGLLAIATMLFATSQFINANTSAFYNNLAGHVAPRWISVTSGIIGALALYFFMLFLFAFAKVPSLVRAIVLLGTLEFIILTVIERSETKVIGEKIVFSSHPIQFRTYLYIVIGWYLLLLGTLFISFLVYGLQNRGLARVRMLYISSGFFVIFVVIGAIPLLLVENSTIFVRNFATVLGAMILLSAPLLLIGFAPPKWLVNKYPEAKTRNFRRSAIA